MRKAGIMVDAVARERGRSCELESTLLPMSFVLVHERLMCP